MDNEVDPRTVPLHADVLQAKGALCDAQHRLQNAQAEVEAAQRRLALSEQALAGANWILSKLEEKKPDA